MLRQDTGGLLAGVLKAAKKKISFPNLAQKSAALRSKVRPLLFP